MFKYAQSKFVAFYLQGQKNLKLARRIEDFARVAMPMYTLVFTILYFGVCIIGMAKMYNE